MRIRTAIVVSALVSCFAPAQLGNQVDPRSDDSAPPLIIHECSFGKKSREKWLGDTFRFKAPDSAERKRNPNGDRTADLIRYAQSDNWLTITSSAYGYPTDGEMTRLKQVHRRPIKVVDDDYPSRGADYRGVTNDGKYWRWVGGWNYAQYEVSSVKASRYFDRIIDSVCFLPILTD